MGRIMVNTTDEKVYKNIVLKAIELNNDQLKDEEAKKRELIKYVKSLYEVKEEK